MEKKKMENLINDNFDSSDESDNESDNESAESID